MTVSGAGTSVSTLAMDGLQHTFYVNPSQALTFTVPADGTNSRYRFNDGGSSSTTWSYTTAASGTDTKTSTVYYQLKQTLSYSVVGGGVPSAPTATGSALGVAYVTSLTTSAAPYWFDASGSIAFSTSFNGGDERWAPSPASVLATQTNTQVVNMNHQYQVTFQQSGVGTDAGSNAVLTLGSTDYGQGSLPQTGIWVDDGTTFSYAGIVAVSSAKHYSWTSNTGDLTSPIHATGIVTGNYATITTTIQSSNAVGVTVNVFTPVETVYTFGSGYLSEASFNIFVVIHNPSWSTGDTLIDVRSSSTSATASSSGILSTTQLWANPSPGLYDIVADINGNGQYDAGEAIDNADVTAGGTGGFLVVPEYALGGLAALGACFVGFAAFKKRSSLPQLHK